MFEKLMQILKKDNVFLSGGAGTGKSFLSMQVIQAFRKKGEFVVVLSSSALSALNIGGLTLHSFLVLGICNNLEELAINDKKRKKAIKELEKLLKKCKLLVIDEISMVSANLFEMIAYRLKSCAFKGRLLIVGDFCQLPPVFKAHKGLFGFTYAYESAAWEDFKLKYLLLTQPKRSKDLHFYKHLSKLRFGELDFKSLEYFSKLWVADISDDFSILCALNKKVDSINDKRLSLIKGKEKLIEGIKSIEDPSLSEQAYENWLKSINASLFLRLKIGAKIIFCVNNKTAGYVNGEQGVIKDFDEDNIVIEKEGEELYIKRYAYKLSVFYENGEEFVRAAFYQYPIKLAYAITMHKAQGMSIKKLVVDIDKIFENAQLYVALSRSSDPKYLKIISKSQSTFKQDFKKCLKFNKNIYDFYKNQSFLELD